MNAIAPTTTSPRRGQAPGGWIDQTKPGEPGFAPVGIVIGIMAHPGLTWQVDQVNQGGIEVESYKHKLAKEVLCSWLREAAAKSQDKYAQIGGFNWRVDGIAPDYGVFIEYPICSRLISGSNIWDWEQQCLEGISQPPTLDELINLNEFPDVIFDVAIRRKGQISIAFEVTHKHAPNIEKICFVHNLFCAVFEISAEWILRQVKIPSELYVASSFGGGVIPYLKGTDWGLKEFKEMPKNQGWKGGAA